MRSDKINSAEVAQWLQSMNEALRPLVDGCMPKIIGIQTGGVIIANQLQRLMHIDEPVGELNISFYRDDFSRIGLHPRVGASNIPYPIDEETIILVDDVLYSGRTVRAAMNEIFDFGRPNRIILATLIERSGREIPVSADVVGSKLQLTSNQRIKLKDDLSMEVSTI